jgi:hypothetical protein
MSLPVVEALDVAEEHGSELASGHGSPVAVDMGLYAMRCVVSSTFRVVLPVRHHGRTNRTAQHPDHSQGLSSRQGLLRRAIGERHGDPAALVGNWRVGVDQARWLHPRVSYPLPLPSNSGRLAMRCRTLEDLEIIALHHQLQVLRRQVVRPTLSDDRRTLLGEIAAAFARLGRTGWLVTPDTLLRW